MSYIALKHLHTTIITLTLLLFILRGAWMFAGSAMLERRWVKITPHILHTLLLLSAFGVAWVGYGWPLGGPAWISVKFVGLLAYIALGVIALKPTRALNVRASAFVGALVVYGYLAAVAYAKSAIPF